MSTEREHPFVMNVVRERPATITDMSEITVTAGNVAYFDITFDRGAPALTNAQIQQMRLEIYTDAARETQLGRNEEQNYSITAEPTEGEDAVRVTFNLNDVVISSDTTLYPKLVFNQG